MNRTLIIATAGHVDHGKSSLVKALTGTDTDTLAEEVKRGLTINLGYAYSSVTTEDGQTLLLGFVDVPGHTDFINNMLAGVAAVQGALLVVAADDGIMPQTREHLAILDLLGVHRGIVALTKIDRCGRDQVQQRSNELRQLLADTALARAPVLPVSSLRGEGIDSLCRELARLQAEEHREAARHDQNFRFLIDRSFSVRGIGTVVTGTALAGTARLDEEFMHSASGQIARVRGIRLHETDIETLQAGQRAALNITLPQQSLRRGDWLFCPTLQRPLHRADVQLRLLDANTRLQSGRRYHLYTNASHRLVTLRSLGAQPTQFYQFKCREPLFLQHGDRFIIRDPADSTTLGGGEVLDTFVPARQRDSKLRRQQLESQTLDPAASIQRLLGIWPGIVNLNRFCMNRNLSLDSALERDGSLLTGVPGSVLLSGPSDQRWLIGGGKLAELQDSLKKTLAAFHKNNPSLQGLSEADLMRFSGLSPGPQFTQALIGHLLRSGDLVRSGSLLHLPSHSVRLLDKEKRFLAEIRKLLTGSDWIPPRTRELVDMTGVPLNQLESRLRELARNGHVIQVAENRYFLPETLWDIAGFTEKLASRHPEGFTVIQFRDDSGIGRNLCIEILEYFDGLGFTQRRDNIRRLRKPRAEVFKPPRDGFSAT